MRKILKYILKSMGYARSSEFLNTIKENIIKMSKKNAL